MKTCYRLLLVCWACCLGLSTGEAQGIATCAASHLRTSQRTAVASPEHQRLMRQYDVTFYKLDLQLERNSTFIAGTVTINARATADGLRSFGFELHPNFTIDRVTVNGQEQAELKRDNSDVTVPLPTALPAGQGFSVAITYHGTAPTGASAAIGNGFSTDVETTWGNHVTWSLSEPYAAYEWWPTKQSLTDKADSVYVFVTTSADNKVGSNGLLTDTVELPNNKKRYEWKCRYPIAYYLVSVAVSNYEEYVTYAHPAGAAAPVPIVNYVYSGGALERYKDQMDLTASFMEHYSELFTLYPFAKEKYGHSMAPIGGGMEHQTMTTQSSFEFSLTAHELAHQWFGDNVTCASWSDIWLNEGFASYGEYLSLQQFASSATAADAWLVRAHQYGLKYPEGSVYVEDTATVSRIFDTALTYKKAASVIHMLRYTLHNDAQFFDALRTYQQRYGGGTATTQDLKLIFEEVSDLDLDYFFDQWYYGHGYPLLAVEWSQQEDTLLLSASQTGSSSQTPFFKTEVEYLLQTTAGDTTIRVPQDQPQEQYRIQVPAQVTNVEVDPQHWLLLKSTIQHLQNPLQEQEPPILYPNPALTAVNVAHLGFLPATAEVYDALGRLVKRIQLLQQYRISVPVQDLPAGLYQLQLQGSGQRYRSSFVKLR